MRSLLVAAALGFELLVAGTTMDSVSAASFPNRVPANVATDLMPAHYQRGYDNRGYHRPHYAPPPRHHWHRHAPPPHHHSWRHQRPFQYGPRY